jgi:hypothetical protein
MQPERFIILLSVESREKGYSETILTGKIFSSASEKPNIVEARRLPCYWANRELGMTTVELYKQLRISQPTVSRASQRGERIVMENEFKL